MHSDCYIARELYINGIINVLNNSDRIADVMLACDRLRVGTNQRLKLAFAASPLRLLHLEIRGKPGWFGINNHSLFIIN